MGFIKEFKEFATKGNVMDLAVGIIIGSAFGKIISSLVADIIMPPIGLIVGGVKFTDLKLTLKAAGEDSTGKVSEAVTLNVGNFIQAAFDFLIIAAAIFLIVKVINKLKRKKAEEPPAPKGPTVEVQLLTEIRDLLQKK
ncbi:large-conductance mechanosensitive channel protein MscL [Desulfosporosinus fructosivorans]|uniref:Large-conductance mechanosensitive channel n=1 Tax=Desulfosporosinus fructosivorans TaxID=2018669 RepID=A0A4Z0R8A2_9FIRM|nr:large-conductance mechanosensitive channel protein MscL [Desulfosporosinus fructosivorans]TGE39401.1 large-conductance mechanosensitive channel protein MscL [Desulfosporosinus fructosivorans]